MRQEEDRIRNARLCYGPLATYYLSHKCNSPYKRMDNILAGSSNGVSGAIFIDVEYLI